MVDAPKRVLHGLILLDLFAYEYPLITLSYSETLKTPKISSTLCYEKVLYFCARYVLMITSY